MTPLPLASDPPPPISCDNCGQCCTTIGTPPGFAGFHPVDGVIPQYWLDSDDYKYYMSAPEAVRAALARYYADVQAGREDDRSGYDCPCLWLDLDTLRCKNYEHRPQVCREFAVGSVACRGYRAEGGLGPKPEDWETDDE